MALLRAIFAATVAELALLGFAMGVLSLAGARSGWLDVAAELAPAWLVISLVGAALAWPALGGVGARLPILLVALAGVAANAALMAPEALRPIPNWRGAAPHDSLTFVSLNVWTQNIAKDETVDLIIAQGADVVAVQELQGITIAPMRRLLAAYPYQTPCPRGCHVALFSRRPWIESSARLGPAPLAWGVTTAPDGAPVAFATTHLSWPLPPEEQAMERSVLAAEAAAIQRPDLVLTGDFNLAPWSWALRRLDSALAPLTRRERGVFTWPAVIDQLDRPAPFPFLAIDHVYAGPAWRTVEVRRLPRTGSDHFGLRVVLTRAAPPR